MKKNNPSATPGANANQIALRRQRWLMAGFGLIAILIAGLVVGLQGTTTNLGDIIEPSQLTIPSEELDPGQLWRASAEQDIKILEESEKSMRDALIAMEQRLAEFSFDIERARIAEQEAAFEREMLLLSSTESPSTQAPPTDRSDAVIPPLLKKPEIRLVRVNDLAGTQPAVTELSSTPATPVSPVAAITESVSDSYMPAGTFMSAVILGGLDAPTGSVARDNPHPVLLRVAAKARLPNLVRFDVRECLVLAAGYGDISSERALLRVERMSCQRHDGSFFDESVRGFIVGDDGRAGVRGRLVTKQGQLLQRSLIAGIGAGFSELFRTQQSEQLRALTRDSEGDPSPSTFPSLGDYATTGVASGASSALNRLADYYISLAEQVYPVIEVGAGREVDIVLQEGIDLEKKPAPQ